MTGKKKVISLTNPGPQPLSRLKTLTALSAFKGPPARFMVELLAVQCRLTGAQSGVIVRTGEQGRPVILACHPPLPSDGAESEFISRVTELLPQALSKRETLIVPAVHEAADDKHASERQIILIPIENKETAGAAAAFVLAVRNQRCLAACRDQLEITPVLLNQYELRLTLDRHQAAVARLGLVIEVLAAVNRAAHFKSAAMALCNELATRLGCARVSIGFLKGRGVHVQGTSHTNDFSRAMQLIQDIEALMEECLDQDVEIIHPAPRTARYADRSAAAFARRHGPCALLSLPLRRNDDVIGVLTLERPAGRPFNSIGDIETARLVCDICTPRLIQMHADDRWVGARITEQASGKLKRLLGPEHTWMKLTGLAACFLLFFVIFAKGDYRIETPFVFEAPVRQVVVAPFDSFIRKVAVDPGDTVEAGRSRLGELDTSQLRLELAALRAERLEHDKQMAAAMRDGKTAEAQIAEAGSQKCAAQIQLLEQHIRKASLVAPIAGRVVSEDLKAQIGAPVETGQILFEIARIEDLRAELYVPQELIPDVRVGQKGQLATVGRPDQKIGFEVDRIHPMAEVVNDKNVFRVRARLEAQFDWMRPGMEGLAKIGVAKRSYLWMGSHRLANWLRMKLWL